VRETLTRAEPALRKVELVAPAAGGALGIASIAATTARSRRVRLVYANDDDQPYYSPDCRTEYVLPAAFICLNMNRLLSRLAVEMTNRCRAPASPVIGRGTGVRE
jgi:hypothetical protein